MRGVKLCVLDVGLMQAGASMKGEFEQRLRSVIDEVQNSPTPIILFIDEAHTLIGAGGAAGTGDAANLLKPALARGTLRTIAATTWAEYKKYFEKDAALSRRFQVIKVEEPAIDSAVQMMRGITAMLVDMDSPGVTVRPLRAMNDKDEFSETFFDGVRVPKSRLIGEVNAGWQVAMSMLRSERGGKVHSLPRHPSPGSHRGDQGRKGETHWKGLPQTFEVPFRPIRNPCPP